MEIKGYAFLVGEVKFGILKGKVECMWWECIWFWLLFLYLCTNTQKGVKRESGEVCPIFIHAFFFWMITNGIRARVRAVCQRGRWASKGWIVRSHVDCREQNIPYMGVETSS